MRHIHIYFGLFVKRVGIFQLTVECLRSFVSLPIILVAETYKSSEVF